MRCDVKRFQYQSSGASSHRYGRRAVSKYFTWAGLLLAAGFQSVASSLASEPALSEVVEIRHPRPGASFPYNLAPPEFEWQPRLDIENYFGSIVAAGQTFNFEVKGARWQPSEAIWRKIAQGCRGQTLTFTVFGKDANGKTRSSATVSYRISQYKCDDTIVYRLVRPPFNPAKTPHTYLREVGSFKVRPFLLGRKRYCFNCHTFSDPHNSPNSKLAIQVRDQEGGMWFGIYDMQTRRGEKVEIELDTAMSTYMAWHPDGKRLALCVNQALRTLTPVVHVSQVAVQPTSDLALYDVDKKEVHLMPHASSPDRLEMYPRFSPDGKLLAFCAGPVVLDQAGKLDIYLMDFNEGKGSPPRPLPGGAHNGRSNFYPRFSPDGKWISFVQAERGSLIKPSSDLSLYNRQTGEVRKLECNVPEAADSWYAWSSNSRFLLFASKRDDGIYARVYLTEIAEDGRAYPPVRLPEDDALRDASRCFSYNIPEFLRESPSHKESDLFNAVKAGGEAAMNIKPMKPGDESYWRH